MGAGSRFEFTSWQPGGVRFEFGGYGINGQHHMTGPRRVTSQGKYFIVAFLQNGFSDDSPRREILVTGTTPSTTVTVTMNKSTFNKTIQVGKGETVTFDLPKPSEVKGSGVCPCTTIIKSDADITVMARNFKKTSGDVSLIYPVDQWGTDYYIITPSNGPSNHYPEFAAVAKGPSNHYPEFSVVNTKMESTVNISLTGAVQFKGKSYKKGDTLTTNMEPFESLQLQSIEDLSGTKVTSQHPVAVLSGHSCAPSNEGCSHVFEQLQPVTSWGTSFFVPGMSFQSKSDQVFALASKSACFEYQSGGNKMKTKVEAGQLMRFNVSVSSPLSIHSTERIQVLLFGTGGKYKGKPFGPFMTKVPDVNSFNLQFNLIGQDNFDNNLGIIIAKSSIAPEIQYDEKVLNNTKWNVFPQSDYSWTEYNCGGGSSSNKLKHPTTPFGVLSIGYSKDMAYGTVAPDIQGPNIPISPVPETKGPGVMISPVPEIKGPGVILTPVPEIKGPNVQISPVPETKGPEAIITPVPQIKGPNVQISPVPETKGPEMIISPVPEIKGPNVQISPVPETKGPEMIISPVPEIKGPNVQISPVPETKGLEMIISPVPEIKGPNVQISPVPETKGPGVILTPVPEIKGPFVQISPVPETKGPTVQISPVPETKGPNVQISPVPETKGPGVILTPVPEIKGPNVQISPVPETKGPGFGLEGQQGGKNGHFEFTFGVPKGNEGKPVQQQMGEGPGFGLEGQQGGKNGHFEFTFGVPKGNEGKPVQQQMGEGPGFGLEGQQGGKNGHFEFTFGVPKGNEGKPVQQQMGEGPGFGLEGQQGGKNGHFEFTFGVPKGNEGKPVQQQMGEGFGIEGQGGKPGQFEFTWKPTTYEYKFGVTKGNEGTVGQPQTGEGSHFGFTSWQPGGVRFEYGGNGPQHMAGPRRVTSQGKYFIVAFLQNGFSDDSPMREILVTGTTPSSTVTVTMNKSTFNKTIQVGKGETVTFDLPKPSEIKGSGVCPCTTIIKSDSDITVMARNFKKTSGDVSLIYPVDQWDREYYIITPSSGPSASVAKGPSNHYPEFAVVTYEFETTVNISFTGSVQFKGKSYKKGDTLTTNMEPFQSLQIQSEDDLSGTKVNSQHPVAVLSGHSCAPSNEGCSHVFEQLQPVTSWGTSYLVPGMSFQSKSDQVFALASTAATFEYQSGGKKMKTNVEAGQLMKFNVSVSSPLSIHSTERIQVLLFGTGGKYKGKPFGSFFTKIPDVNSFNLRYNLIGQDNFDNNLGIIIAKSSIAPEIQYNGKVLDITNWNMFPESDYSWAEYSYGAGSSSNKMKHPTSPFGLLSIGYSKDMAYGTVAPSIQGQGVPITPVPEIKGPNVQIAPVPETKGSGFGIEGQQEGKPGHFEFKFGVSKGNEGKAVQQQMGAGSGSGTEGQQIGKPGQFEFSWKPATFQYKFDVSKGNEGTAGQPQTGAGSQPGSSSWQSGGFNFQFGGNGQQDMTGPKVQISPVPETKGSQSGSSSWQTGGFKFQFGGNGLHHMTGPNVQISPVPETKDKE
ncbi:uncharacterized protein [Engystomops pustulosus]|uniref:uncharacterized protein n=1 Tax=Engystomops pustulosus TaxID=76066 RepID=UPI003AFB53D0